MITNLRMELFQALCGDQAGHVTPLSIQYPGGREHNSDFYVTTSASSQPFPGSLNIRSSGSGHQHSRDLVTTFCLRVSPESELHQSINHLSLIINYPTSPIRWRAGQVVVVARLLIPSREDPGSWAVKTRNTANCLHHHHYQTHIQIF